jgi:hypothetical protein
VLRELCRFFRIVEPYPDVKLKAENLVQFILNVTQHLKAPGSKTCNNSMVAEGEGTCVLLGAGNKRK